MATTLANYITTLARLSGVSEDEANSLGLTEKLGELSLPDEVQTKLNNNILTKDAAKNNSEVVGDIKAKTLNGIDAQLETIMTGLGWDNDKIKEFKGNSKNSYSLTTKLFDSIKNDYTTQLEELKSNSGDDSKAQEAISNLNSQIEGLNNELLQERSKTQEVERGFNTKLLNYQLDNKIASKKYSDKIPANLATKVARTAVDEYMNQNNISLMDSENGIELKQGEQDFYLDNKKVGVDDMLTHVLTSNNLLAMQNKPSVTQTPIINSEGEVPGLDNFMHTLKDRNTPPSAQQN